MASQPIPFATPEEYLELEHEASIKHEYLDGEIVAMSGTSFKHNLIVSNVSHALAEQLKGTPCRVLSSDLRVSIPSNRLYCYPDISIACPPFHLIPGLTDTLTNPVFLIEILSRSTQAHDRGYKLPLYRDIPSLTGYLLIDQYQVSVEYGSRISDGTWRVEVITDSMVILDLASIHCRLPVASIYANVDYPV